MRRKFENFKKLCLLFAKSDAGAHASAASYYILLSIPSCVVLAASTLPYIPTLLTQLSTIIHSTVPTEFLPVMSDLLQKLHENKSSALLPISFLITLWSSSKGIAAILSGLHAAFHVSHAGFIKRRLRSMLFVILLCLALILFHFLFAASWIFLQTASASGSVLQVFLRRISNLQILTKFILIILPFSICYKIIFKKSLYRHSLAAAAAAAAGWLITSQTFSYYVRWTIMRRRMFSSLNILFVGAVWLRFSVMIFFYGAVLNRIIVTANTRKRTK